VKDGQKYILYTRATNILLRWYLLRA